MLSGAFPSGRDKRGTAGVAVLVHNVTISAVKNEADGDWHLEGSDASIRGPFILEIIPRDQGNISKPPKGVKLAVLGVPFCDRSHEDEAWHGNSCWELHPVLGWQREP